MQHHVELETAIRIMENLPFTPEVETACLEEAYGRVLAENVDAAFPMPSFDKSPFDGFAFCTADVPGTLPVVGVIAAGDQNIPALARGTAVRIFTGAPVPQGADAVLKFEDTSFDERAVTVTKPVASGTNVIRTGEDYAAGTPLLQRGQRLTAPRLGVAASQGIGKLAVYKKPKAVILATGTELFAPGEEKQPYGIYNSSYYTLRGYLEQMGFDVASPFILSDNSVEIADAVKQQMESDADIVITTGGASVGDYDYAVNTAETIGAEVLFWKVNIKPGGALLVSRKGSKVLLGLSGNPAAAIMCLLVIVQPYLRKLTGETTGNQTQQLPIMKDMPKTSSAARLLRGHAVLQDGRVYFEEHGGSGNRSVASYQNCTLIGVIPAGSGPVKAGDAITVLQLPVDLHT